MGIYGSKRWTYFLTFINRDKTGRDLETTCSQIMRLARYLPVCTHGFDQDLFPALVGHTKESSSQTFFVRWSCVCVDESRPFQLKLDSFDCFTSTIGDPYVNEERISADPRLSVDPSRQLHRFEAFSMRALYLVGHHQWVGKVQQGFLSCQNCQESASAKPPANRQTYDHGPSIP